MVVPMWVRHTGSDFVSAVPCGKALYPCQILTGAMHLPSRSCKFSMDLWGVADAVLRGQVVKVAVADHTVPNGDAGKYRQR